ncbi:hypothetical protein G7Y89_g2004 [Cudoniella acicularis]|uniref:Uncharacterized protein n=1 Tax=Cudoniella acicularis TaxID=354080 RepID=A0A8H4RU78_9HELO|nr:hypothetical protein G7Y89_g2004 [Cudoniella acicularis]
MFYIHGGAYYLGGIGHGLQIQRHARKYVLSSTVILELQIFHSPVPYQTSYPHIFTSSNFNVCAEHASTDPVNIEYHSSVTWRPMPFASHRWLRPGPPRRANLPRAQSSTPGPVPTMRGNPHGQRKHRQRRDEIPTNRRAAPSIR